MVAEAEEAEVEVVVGVAAGGEGEGAVGDPLVEALHSPAPSQVEGEEVPTVMADAGGMVETRAMPDTSLM